MKQRQRTRRRGFLTFEWILLFTILAIGVIGGLAAVRISLNSELHDLSDAIEALQMNPAPPAAPPGPPSP